MLEQQNEMERQRQAQIERIKDFRSRAELHSEAFVGSWPNDHIKRGYYNMKIEKVKSRARSAYNLDIVDSHLPGPQNPGEHPIWTLKQYDTWEKGVPDEERKMTWGAIEKVDDAYILTIRPQVERIEAAFYAARESFKNKIL
ncbi:conserved hypothetical protein [Sporisorium reilianum SRZ2]|uniref:Uncharacterized protein n=1 Tax=Sporisorium reilianum (strain SRZ2) TaxID=999809 RepID=E6ZN52_SPORE|nr:conserved hypothetical protein [Sporisorium reilianum SRZ2]